ncbi:molybdopterin molybdotransferase MoeA [Dongia rigui]|uniref:Molybdopterin molybdenumtransferase n=1 Tax=Dongia rigui TaxID=940149 RepID=A0ABU5E3D5_9PROT|nr:gephyrin-like molybdotransferase Glp [Dongia rigui]MDY0874033.1 molybdopterin molybdotransferase MoeA [Dongia rigui]
MLPVAEAQQRILSTFAPLVGEVVGIDRAVGRVLSAPVVARLSQPPAAVSAMDGYAVRAADLGALPVKLRVIGTIAAGIAPAVTLKPGQAARIFTGAILPGASDTIVIQENCDRDGDHVTVREGSTTLGQHVRAGGNDFRLGEVGLEAGRLLSARDIALAAAMNWPSLSVTRRPRVALLSTGDELQHPGEPLGPAQIIASNGIGLAAFVTACGGEPINLGIARDNMADLHRALDGARGADVLVTTGGASVGELDLIQQALKDKGAKLDFWKIAMRPGKPVMFGTLGALPVLGLPGNPVSAIVTATLFLRPLIQHLLGQKGIDTQPVFARLGTALKANDQRQDYLRATLTRGADGSVVASPFPKQDSAMLSLIAKADALIIRPPHAPAAKEGDVTEILPLSGGCLGI